MEWWGHSGMFGGQTLWTPAQITTALWLDASDSATVTTVSGAVSEWRDKSGNNLHISQSVAANRPIYTSNALAGKPVLSFDGVNDTLERSTGLDGLSSVTILSVFRINSGSNDDIPLAVGTATSSTARGFYRSAGGSAIVAAGYANDFISTLQWDLGNYHVFGFMNPQLATPNNFKVDRDGDEQSGTGSGGNLLPTTAGFAVGSIRGVSPTHCTNMDIAEVIVLASAALTGTWQQMQGYLAHKWGLTGSLPAGHPYKSAPPYV